MNEEHRDLLKKRIADLPPLPISRPVKYPHYAVFGNPGLSWEVDILRGHGRVEIIKVYTVEQMKKAYNAVATKKGKEKRLTSNGAYLLAHDKAMEYKVKMEKEHPLI